MGPRQEGFEAHQAGKSLEDNPYPEQGSIYSNHAQWEEGWYDAQTEARGEDEDAGGDQGDGEGS
jgi:hypothetical protein